MYNRYRSELVFPDASDSPCGAFVKSDSGLVCLFVFIFFLHQNWSPEEKERSSTCREPEAVCLASKAFAGRLSNARVIWYSDYQNVESALLNGSRKLDLQMLAFKHYRFVLSIAFHSMLGGYFIDFISKLVDFDDYAINDFVFRVFMTTGDRIPRRRQVRLYGYYTTLPRFIFRFSYPGCEAVGAFSQVLGYDNNCLCLPFV